MFGFRDEFRSAIERAHAVIEFKLDGTILYANEDFLALSGYVLPDIIGKRHSILVSNEYRRSPEYERFWNDLAKGTSFAAEYCRLRKDGSEFWVSGSYNPVLRSGRVHKIVKVATDITAKMLRRAHDKSKLAALDRAQAIAEFSLDGTIVTANQNFLKTFDYSEGEVLGRHHRMFVDPAEAEGLDYQTFWQRLRAGQFDAAEYRRIGKGGREVWIQASYNPLLDASGRLLGVIKFATDVTAARNLSRQLQADADRVLAEAVGIIAESVSDISGQAGSAADAVAKASENIRAVAVGSTQIAASASEISEKVLQALTVSKEAVREASQVNTVMADLADQAGEIEDIVSLITTVASQTNLLALNATIEAARAGNAGRGFAVVAGEVKNLAGQTERAAQDITGRIASVQSASVHACQAIQQIGRTIEHIHATAAQIANEAATQSSVTQIMSASMQEVAGGVTLITTNLHRTAQLTQTVDQRIGEIREAVKVIA
ncbi:methyl-accepting chemotaxis protein [Bosea sp. CRIB-10]|uniref:methyl-accepting chemotaxis protein n=1 Tax=Bosea sp. CRIB-10 TaxID=378404 RepID=UPI0008E4095E|nr:PAS domain-containing methyl-accepting chemotaxis protein [Bosea sp. CRIB-10]SFD75584.1 methyl-accepting chemotaxis protein [Bosea sp. CRIB-10]